MSAASTNLADRPQQSTLSVEASLYEIAFLANDRGFLKKVAPFVKRAPRLAAQIAMIHPELNSGNYKIEDHSVDRIEILSNNDAFLCYECEKQAGGLWTLGAPAWSKVSGGERAADTTEKAYGLTDRQLGARLIELEFETPSRIAAANHQVERALRGPDGSHPVKTAGLLASR